MAGMSQNYDAALLGILQNEGQISDFLDAVFGFLFRRTDFYLLMKEKEGKMGFPPGVAANIAFSAFKKYETMALDRAKKQEQPKEKPEKMDFAGSKETPPVVETVEVSSADSVAKSTTPPPAESSQVKEASVSDKKSNGSATAEKIQDPPANDKNNVDRDEDDDPELTKKQKVYQANPESYNGALRENYSWSQMITDVDVRIMVPKNIVKGRDVRVTIQRKHLKASYRDGNDWKDLIDEDLMWDINKEESMWTLVPGEHIHVNLEKIQERWWEALIVSEEKINVRKIDASRPMTDLDDEAQSKIHEMMYNEQQKRLGLPQSHEAKVHTMLKKAWDAEGSPFKGQDFDPSKFNVAPGGT